MAGWKGAMDVVTFLLSVHAAATLFMVGVIWFVQVVHYPLMARVPPGAFVAYELEHTRRTGWVVAPVMVVELASALAVTWLEFGSPCRWPAVAGALLLTVIWLSTFAIQVPLHERLCRGFDVELHRRLVASNWIRTVAWTLRGGIALLLLAH